jgi:hypothetical protein
MGDTLGGDGACPAVLSGDQLADGEAEEEGCAADEDAG